MCLFVCACVLISMYICDCWFGCVYDCLHVCACVSTMDTHRDAEEPLLRNLNPGRRTSWVKEAWKVWMCVSVSEDPPPPGDTL